MFLTFHEVLPDSVLFVTSSKFSFLRCNFFIISHLVLFVKYINCELKFFSIYSLPSTSQRNAYNLFSALSRSKLSLSLAPLSLRCTLLPASVFLSFPLPVLHTLSSSLTPSFLVRQLYYYSTRIVICQADISTKFTAFFG